jgi:Gluconate 2-dehydrogenase subunit 3
MVNSAAVAAAQEKAASATFTPEFLDAHQFQTLETLAEAIVPGSTEARVAPFLDTLLAVESADDQERFFSALGAFDMLAIEAHQKPWTKLSAAEQNALLEKASTAEPGRRAFGAGRFAGTEETGTTTIGDHFNTLRGAVSSAYYSSEKGMRELGWTGNVFHQALPGCEHPEGHTGG